MEAQQYHHEQNHPPTMEVTVNHYRDQQHQSCNTSFNSLRSLVSKDIDDSLILDDEEGFEYSHNNGAQWLDAAADRSSQLLQRQYSSQQSSIATEMAIIASSSPEIKALSDQQQPITPNYPNEINFDDDMFQPSSKAGSGLSDSATTDGFSNHPKYVSPLPAVDREMVNHQHLTPRAATPSRAMEREDAFMEDADELAVYLERTSIEGSSNRPSPLVVTGQKENVVPPPCFDLDDKTPEASNTTTTRSHGGGSFSFKSAMRAETRRHRSLSSMGVGTKRPSYHRRVSFDSLPSPSEITTTTPSQSSQQQRSQRSTVQHTTCTNYQRSKSFELGTKSPLAMDFPF